jgi:uncharacterized membrane protein YbhN (UPF0104 family)
MSQDATESSRERHPSTTGINQDKTLTPADPTTPEAAKRSGRKAWLSPPAKKALQIIVSLVLLGAIFWYVLRQFADLSEVWAAMQTLSWGPIALLAVVTIWNLITYWFVIITATPGLRLSQAAVLTQSTRP